MPPPRHTDCLLPRPPPTKLTGLRLLLAVLTMVACYGCECARRPLYTAAIILVGCVLRAAKFMLIATHTSTVTIGRSVHQRQARQPSTAHPKKPFVCNLPQSFPTALVLGLFRFRLSLIAVGVSTIMALMSGCSLLYAGGLQVADPNPHLELPKCGLQRVQQPTAHQLTALGLRCRSSRCSGPLSRPR